MSDAKVDQPEPTPAHLARQLERSFAGMLATLALLEPAEIESAGLGWHTLSSRVSSSIMYPR